MHSWFFTCAAAGVAALMGLYGLLVLAFQLRDGMAHGDAVATTGGLWGSTRGLGEERDDADRSGGGGVGGVGAVGTAPPPVAEMRSPSPAVSSADLRRRGQTA
eukprot:scaffold14198_cov124-Isochrysis_galbana.AAC.4